MQKLHKKQQGLTLISLIFVLGLIGKSRYVKATSNDLTAVGIKFLPPSRTAIAVHFGLANCKVVQALESIKNRPGIEHESKNGVWNALSKQFGMNYVYDIKRKNVKITSRPGYLKVKIVYHTKQLLFANLSVWVDFDNEIEVGKQ
jgi:hypothetical protein